VWTLVFFIRLFFYFFFQFIPWTFDSLGIGPCFLFSNLYFYEVISIICTQDCEIRELTQVTFFLILLFDIELFNN
jgi:hypothetical protein